MRVKTTGVNGSLLFLEFVENILSGLTLLSKTLHIRLLFGTYGCLMIDGNADREAYGWSV